MLEQVKGLETSRAQPPENPTTSVFEEFILPANSLEDISAIDNYLQSEEVFSKAVSIFFYLFLLNSMARIVRTLSTVWHHNLANCECGMKLCMSV